MKKIHSIIIPCLIIIICTLGLLLYAQTSSINVNKGIPLNGPETALLISKLYETLGSRIGCHLVEPNAALTFAGLRSDGNFLMHNLTNKEKTAIKKANNTATKLAIRFNIFEDTEDELCDISITNLNGAEYSSKLSNLPFIKPFDATLGFDGLSNWINTISDAAKKYFTIHANEPTENALTHLMIGLSFGYPDQALLDSYGVLSKGLTHEKLIYSQIPYSDYYENPQPNFGYLPEHADEESITLTIQTWGNLLKDFYNTPWAKLIANDIAFAYARLSEKKEHDDWFKRKQLNIQLIPA